MVKFRQPIRPGQRGRDVLAVKHGLLVMGTRGSGALGRTNRAGPQFVKCIKLVQKHHGLKQDGIYGKQKHKVIAPHFSAFDRWRYRTARIRRPKQPAVQNLSAQAAAKRLLEFHAQGKYRADNPGDLRDLQATAAGKPVWSQGGYWVHIDKRPLEILVWLIEKGFHIGTFAICSDHHWDGPHGHAGGKAVDISSIDGVMVSSSSERAHYGTLKVAELLRHNPPAGLRPWQLICDGSGYEHNDAISACTIPGAAFYGYTTMSQHRNHIHVGYYE